MKKSYENNGLLNDKISSFEKQRAVGLTVLRAELDLWVRQDPIW